MENDKVTYSVNVETLKLIYAIMGNADKDKDKDNRGKLQRDAINITVSPSKELVYLMASNGFTVYKIVVPFKRFLKDYENLFGTLENDLYYDLKLETLKFAAKSPDYYFNLELRQMKDNLIEKFTLLLNNVLNSEAETYFNKYNPSMLVNIFKGLKTLKIKSVTLTKRKSQFFVHAETEDKIKISFAICAMYNPREPVKEPYEF